MTQIGIIGAGLAGVGVAHALAGGDALAAAAPEAVPPEEDVRVTILEKSRGVGGRAATRRREGTTYYYDHGANYVKEADDRTVRLIHELGEDGLVGFREPVWPFDGEGGVSESDREPETKYTWETGITQFAKRLLAETDAEVRHSTRAAGLSGAAGAWTVRDTDGETHGPFDAVVCTPPAPQTAQLVAETNATDGSVADETTSALSDRLSELPFRTTRTVIAGYERRLDRPWYALVNTDGDHAVGWLAREECKTGHVPDGETMLILQMAPAYSERTYDDPIETVGPDAAERAAELVGESWLADPAWLDDQGWRYAQPDASLVGSAERDELASAGVFLAGDWLVPDGKGRVHEAYWQGVGVAERVSDAV